ncbi:DUF4142 domain-containing protein [Chitinophaga sp. NPDC101104]|uniref:DUF4142 domain-containing protein n=1 Tax=Chitinophaga sp. NPDC101104 TaxID=3390561 RepID=UPI003D022810
MKRMMVYLLPFAMGFAACNNGGMQNNSDTTLPSDTGITEGMAKDVNRDVLPADSVRDDSKNLVKAAEDGLFEVRISTDAQSKASSASVKTLAKHMQQSHEKINNELKALAAQKSIVTPTAISDGQSKDISDIMEKSGKDFDKAYVDKLESAHKDAIDLFEKMSEKAEDPDIKAFFTKHLPELRTHLDMVMKEKDKLK